MILLKNTAPQNLSLLSSVNFVIKSFLDFTLYVYIKNTQHGLPIKTENADADDIVNEVDDANLKEEFRSGQHFFADSELQCARHKVFEYAMENLNPKFVPGNIAQFFNNSRCAMRVNLAVGFELRSIEVGGLICFYAHENDTLLYRSQIVCTRDDFAKLKNFLIITDVIESSIREKMNTKQRFYKLTNPTVFAALLKDVPMGCKDAVLPELLLQNGTINCLTFEENRCEPYEDKFCLFRALALHLQGSQRLKEKTAKIFNLFINRTLDSAAVSPRESK